MEYSSENRVLEILETPVETQSAEERVEALSEEFLSMQSRLDKLEHFTKLIRVRIRTTNVNAIIANSDNAEVTPFAYVGRIVTTDNKFGHAYLGLTTFGTYVRITVMPVENMFVVTTERFSDSLLTKTDVEKVWTYGRSEAAAYVAEALGCRHLDEVIFE